MMRNRRHNKAAGCLAALIAACGIFISDSASGASDVTGSSLDDVRREIGEHRTRAESNERDLNSVRSEIKSTQKGVRAHHEAAELRSEAHRLNLAEPFPDQRENKKHSRSRRKGRRT